MAPKTSLSNFTSYVKTTGIASANMYAVDIALPQSLQYKSREELSMIQLFCDQAQLPDQNISTAQTRTYGEIREMPYENLYGNITMSFIVDSEYKVKLFFDDWIQSITDKNTRHINYYDMYTAPTITITMLNNDEKLKYQVVLYECYPKQLNSVSIDYASKDVVKVNVSMNYKYWRSYQVVDQTEGTNIQKRNIFNRLGLVGQNSPLNGQINSLLDKIPEEYTIDFDAYQKSVSDAYGDARNSITGAFDSWF